MDGAVQHAPQRSRHFICITLVDNRLALRHAGDGRADGGGGAAGAAAGAAVHGRAALLAASGLQAAGAPQHLVHHGTHAVAVGGLDEVAAVVKCAARSAQGEGLGR